MNAWAVHSAGAGGRDLALGSPSAGEPAANGGAVLEVVNCGRTFPGHEISIQDEDGRVLPDRQVGEICLRSPSVTPGYWQDAEATRAALAGTHSSTSVPPSTSLQTQSLPPMSVARSLIPGKP